MPIFHWETVVSEIARAWPQSGALFEFFWFWTDYSESRWALLLVLLLFAIGIGWRRMIIPSLMSAAAIGLGDVLSRRVVKFLVMRPRPNYVGMDCDVSKCWGFVSSHATNMVAAATFLTLYDRRNAYWTIPVALLVCFSRIYLNDHFPLDVLGGMALGLPVGFCAWIFLGVVRSRFQRQHVEGTGVVESEFPR